MTTGFQINITAEGILNNSELQQHRAEKHRGHANALCQGEPDEEAIIVGLPGVEVVGMRGRQAGRQVGVDLL